MSMYRNRNKFRLAFPILMILALCGCQSAAIVYQGKMVDSRFTIPLKGNSIEDRWQTDEVVINYGYAENNLVFTIKGQINLTDQYSEIYHDLDRLDVDLLFLDSDGTVIKAENLVNIFSATPQDSLLFNRSYPLPQNTTSFSFAYYGTIRELDRKDGNVTTLFHVPK